MEAADRSSKSFKTTEAAAMRKLTFKPSHAKPCYRCGNNNHNAQDCKSKDAECHFCHKRGHIAPACRQKKSQTSSTAKSSKTPHRRTKWIATEDDEQAPQQTHDLKLFTIGGNSTRPILVDVSINGKQLAMEIDTGAAVTVISEETRKSLFAYIPLHKSNAILRTYTGQQMHVTVELHAQVKYKDQIKSLSLIVVAGNGPSLLGRNWLQHIQLDWKQIGAMTVDNTASNDTLQSLLSKHTEIFKDELGTVTSSKVKLHI